MNETRARLMKRSEKLYEMNDAIDAGWTWIIRAVVALLFMWAFAFPLVTDMLEEGTYLFYIVVICWAFCIAVQAICWCGWAK